MTRVLTRPAAAVNNIKMKNETINYLLKNKRSILINLIVLFGILAGIYLIKQEQILRSHAESPTTINVTKDSPANGSTVKTDTNQIQIKISL